MMTWKKFLDRVVLAIGVAMMVCSGIGAILLYLGNFALAGKFLAAMIFLFALLAMVTSSEDVAAAKRAKREGRTNHEPSAFLQAQDEYNTKSWNTNDFTEPPAIGGKRDP